MPNPPKLSRVMLVDDNEVDLKIHSRIITLTNLFDKIIQCNSADSALSYLHKNLKKPEELPNFILLDIQMPDMNGFEFLEAYKKFPEELTNHCAIVMLSSTLDFGDIKKAEANAYVVKLLKKPLNPAELKELINLYSL